MVEHAAPQVVGPPPDTHAAPVAGAHRIIALDVIRGAAILGILLVNIRLFAGPWLFLAAAGEPYPSVADRLAVAVVDGLVTIKLVSSFSILFGIGLALLHDRLSAHRRPWPVLVRRLLVLLAIGVAHAVGLWTGDILTTYAVAGLIALAFLRRRTSTLAVWGGICFGVVAGLIGLVSIVMGLVTLGGDAGLLEFQAQVFRDLATGAERAYLDGTYLDQVGQRLSEMAVHASDFVFFVPMTLGLMLLGAAAWRSGIISRVPTDPRPVRRIARLGLIIGLPLNLLAGVLSWVSGGAMTGWGMVAQGLLVAFGPILAMGYMATLALAFRARPNAAPFRLFAPVGRMAFTNYLAQSALCVGLFVGLGLYGTVGYALSLLVVVGVWIIEVAWSHAWLARFRMGPLEWLWRSATYGRIVPLRQPADS